MNRSTIKRANDRALIERAIQFHVMQRDHAADLDLGQKD
jgi:hypothetical protein